MSQKRREKQSRLETPSGRPTRWRRFRNWLAKTRAAIPPSLVISFGIMWALLERISMLDWISDISSRIFGMNIRIGATGGSVLICIGLLWWTILLIKNGKKTLAVFSAVLAALAAAYGAFVLGQTLPSRETIQSTYNPIIGNIELRASKIPNIWMNIHSVPLMRFGSKYRLRAICGAPIEGSGQSFPGFGADRQQTSLDYPIQVPMAIEIPLLPRTPILRSLCAGESKRVSCALLFVPVREDGKFDPNPSADGLFAATLTSGDLVNSEFPRNPICKD